MPDVYDSALHGTRRACASVVVSCDCVLVSSSASAPRYYFGSKAGRLRYEQIQRWLAEARQSGPVEKVQAAVEARLERMRQQTEALTGTAIAPDASS